MVQIFLATDWALQSWTWTSWTPCYLLLKSLLLDWAFSAILSVRYWCETLGCGLTKILRSPKVSNHEILGAQHLSLFEKSEFSSRPGAKGSSLWHRNAPRGHPWLNCSFTLGNWLKRLGIISFHHLGIIVCIRFYWEVKNWMCIMLTDLHLLRPHRHHHHLIPLRHLHHLRRHPPLKVRFIECQKYHYCLCWTVLTTSYMHKLWLNLFG